MRKKYFTILVAMLMVLCLVLTACGGNNGNTNEGEAPAGTSDTTETADPNEEFDPPANEVHQEGGYAHDLGGGCVIYTENDLNMFIHDGVFDFYEMMDYFGVTGRVDGIDTSMVYMATRQDSDPSYSVQLEGASSSPHCGAIDIDMGGYLLLKTEFFIGDSDNYIYMTNGYKISYELLAMLLYEMETLDNYGEEAPNVIRNLDLPDTFIIDIQD